MYCQKHPDRASVATCDKCQAEYCEVCQSATAPLNKGNLCVPCAIAVTRTAINENKREIKGNVAKCVLLAIVWIVGIALLAYGAVAGGDNRTLFLILGLAICGLPTAILFAISTNTKRVGTKFAVFFIGLLLGVVANPIKIVVYAKDVANRKKETPQLESALATLQSME